MASTSWRRKKSHRGTQQTRWTRERRQSTRRPSSCAASGCSVSGTGSDEVGRRCDLKGNAAVRDGRPQANRAHAPNIERAHTVQRSALVPGHAVRTSSRRPREISGRRRCLRRASARFNHPAACPRCVPLRAGVSCRVGCRRKCGYQKSAPLFFPVCIKPANAHSRLHTPDTPGATYGRGRGPAITPTHPPALMHTLAA